MTKTLIRFKGTGAVVIEFDPTMVLGYRILELDDYPGIYILTAIIGTNGQEIELAQGRMDECHYILNQIHYQSNTKIIDIK